MQEAAKRCHLDAAFKHEDKKPSWVFHSLACNQLTKKNQKPVLHHSKMDENEVVSWLVIEQKLSCNFSL